MIATEVCLPEGSLEVFMCKKGTKEHESILRTLDALKIHELLIFAGAETGQANPVRQPQDREAGRIQTRNGHQNQRDGSLHPGGKTYTHPAQEWIWDTKKKARSRMGGVRREHRDQSSRQREEVLRRE